MYTNLHDILSAFVTIVQRTFISEIQSKEFIYGMFITIL